MIDISSISKQSPYIKFIEYYEKAIKNNQSDLDAISISSFDKKRQEIDSRFVNLKYIYNDEWIFFSNYNSPKAKQFSYHNQIAALMFWSSINVQIRIKAEIKKTSNEFNQKYFFDRSEEKNALSISSKQSNPIASYSKVKENYMKSLKNDNLKKCPEFWGGFSFIPYYFEFWQGHESRINKRMVFHNIDGSWKESYLQP